MACKIYYNSDETIDKVLAPNMKESILFKTLLAQGLSEEEALRNWALTQTEKFKSFYIDKELILDENGEPNINSILKFNENYQEDLEILNDEILKELEKIKSPIPRIATDERTFDRLKKVLDDQVNALNKRLKEFESSSSRKGYVPKESTVNRIKDLRDKISELDERSKFLEIMKYSKKELNTIHTFLDGSLDGSVPSSFDITNQDHINALIEIKSQLNTYDQLASSLPDFIEKDRKLLEESTIINKLFRNIKDSVNEKFENYLTEFIKNNTKKEISIEDIKSMLKEGEDISYLESKAGGLSNSKSTLLQLLHKYVEEGREEIYEKTNTKAEELTSWKKRLSDLGIKDFDWIIQKDSSGKKTGRILQRTSNDYYITRKAQFDKLKDETGEKREYIVKPLEELTEEEKNYNTKLAKDKRDLATFLAAESKDENGITTDGVNHRYTEEFKKARDFYEGGWNSEITKTDGSKLSFEEFEKAYVLYKRKYYQEPREVYVAKKVKGEYTGEVELKTISFPKSEYVETTDIWNDKEYNKLYEDQSESGKLKLEFYNYYLKEFNNILDKLPISIQESMKGKILRVRGSIVNDVTKNGQGFFSAVKSSLRNFINPEVITSGRQLDENGNPINDVGYYYVGDLKNEKLLERLENKLSELRNELKSDPKNKEVENEIKKIKNKILIEQNKLTPEEINYDLIESLNKGFQMSENYDIMKKIESTLLIAQDLISKKKYYKKTDSEGNQVGEEFKVGPSNTEERLNSYLRMIFYGNSDANNSKILKLVQNFGKYTSIKALGLNPFSAINNGIMANINTRIEGFGRQFGWNNSHLNKATGELNKYLAGGTYIGHFMDKWKNGGLYSPPSNKFEAMLKHFNWLEKLDDRHNKGTSGAVNDLLYIGITAGEFTAQSRSAIAKLLSTEITNKDGKVSNLWDAYEFKDGKLSLKEGFEYTPEQRRKLSVEIKNMNKIIHGNYSETDKAALQEYALGQLALQFKKWMYNYGKNRFGERYYDETSGSYQEGRYRSLVNLFKYWKAAGLTDFKKAYSELDESQKSNMRKNAAEITYFLTALSLYILFDSLVDNLDDDDENLRRAVNYLKKQSDRVRGEIVSMISPVDIYNSLKNPFAALNTAKDLMEFTGEILKTPYYLVNTDEAYYTKGVNKGDLKAFKQFRDIVPVFQLKGQYDQLLNSGSFFFK